MDGRVVLVTGTGGSGTTTLARILHERLYVDMGQVSPSKKHYECSVLHGLLRELMMDHRTHDQWKTKTAAAVTQRPLDRTWGLKSPWLCYLLYDFVETLLSCRPETRIVLLVAERPVALCHRSAARRFGWKYKGRGRSDYRDGLREMFLRRLALRESIADVDALLPRGSGRLFVRRLQYGAVQLSEDDVASWVAEAIRGGTW